MKYFNSRGASLVELMITVGLLGIAATGTLTVMQVVHQNTAVSKENAALSETLNRVATFLSNGEMCNLVLNGYNLNLGAVGAVPAAINPRVPINSITFGGEDMLVLNQTFRGLTTTRMEFTRVMEVLPPSGVNPRYILEFEVDITRAQGGPAGTRSFWIAGTLPPGGGQLLSCSSIGEVEQAVLCDSVGATPPDEGCAIYPTYEYY